MQDIRFTTSRKGGIRAWKWNGYQMRWFPISRAEAEQRIATGQARNITAEYKARLARDGQAI